MIQNRGGNCNIFKNLTIELQNILQQNLFVICEFGGYTKQKEAVFSDSLFY